MIVNVPLDAFCRNAIASMIYDAWCKAFEHNKNVKTLTWEGMNKFCPKAEWPLYHESMIKQAQTDLEKATKLKDAFCHYSPLILGE